MEGGGESTFRIKKLCREIKEKAVMEDVEEEGIRLEVFIHGTTNIAPDSFDAIGRFHVLAWTEKGVARQTTPSYVVKSSTTSSGVDNLCAWLEKLVFPAEDPDDCDDDDDQEYIHFQVVGQPIGGVRPRCDAAGTSHGYKVVGYCRMKMPVVLVSELTSLEVEKLPLLKPVHMGGNGRVTEGTLYVSVGLINAASFHGASYRIDD